MIGIVNTEPAEPLLEIVNVPPWISSGLSLRLRARLARSLISRASAFKPLGLGAADHGRQQTLVVEVDGDAEIDVVVDDELVVADAGVEVRELGQPVDDRPGDERQVREAEALRRLERVLDPKRVASTLAKSTSTTLNACGDVDLLITM